MKYQAQSFSVFAVDSEEYRANWNRIFGDKSLENRVLAYAKQLNRSQSRVLFWPRDFSYIADEDVIIDVLDTLSKRGHFITEYVFSCPDGHHLRTDTSPPAQHGFEICPTCGANIDLNDDLTYDLRVRYILRK